MKNRILLATVVQFLLSYFLSTEFCFKVFAQTNIVCTNPVAEQILLGNYNPGAYNPSISISGIDEIICGIESSASADSLHAWLEKLATFHNRNAGSDTVSASRGIGAARRWAYSKFQEFSAQNENRLIPSFLQFDLNICGMMEHKDVFSLLPGSDTSDYGIIIIEGHLDSRCEGLCDTSCLAQGMEDNGTGTALVIELARIMSCFTFKKTLVFLLTTAEEQGLYGAEAFASYADNLNLAVKAVQNNDIVGGIICGNTSSPPSCPYENHIDSQQVRIFSNGSYALQNRGYARYIKLAYSEKLLSVTDAPMAVSVINQEDRTGRGGDHIPFRSHGFTAVRFTSANEHGDANVSDTSYTDRQHTSSDILGVDTDSDGAIDSFFIDFDYLKRNTVINGVSAGIAAIGPEAPGIQLNNDTSGLSLVITAQTQYPQYRIGVRLSTSPVDFDAVYRFSGSLVFNVPGILKGKAYYISAAAVDSNGVTGPFSREYFVISNSNTPAAVADSLPFKTTCVTAGIDSKLIPEEGNNDVDIKLLPCNPNSSSSTTAITILVHRNTICNNSYITLTGIAGNTVQYIPLVLSYGENRVLFNHSSLSPGAYFVNLFADGKIIQTQKFIIAR